MLSSYLKDKVVEYSKIYNESYKYSRGSIYTLERKKFLDDLKKKINENTEETINEKMGTDDGVKDLRDYIYLLMFGIC